MSYTTLKKLALFMERMHFLCYSQRSFRYERRVHYAHDRCSVLTTEKF